MSTELIKFLQTEEGMQLIEQWQKSLPPGSTDIQFKQLIDTQARQQLIKYLPYILVGGGIAAAAYFLAPRARDYIELKAVEVGNEVEETANENNPFAQTKREIESDRVWRTSFTLSSCQNKVIKHFMSFAQYVGSKTVFWQLTTSPRKKKRLYARKEILRKGDEIISSNAAKNTNMVGWIRTHVDRIMTLADMPEHVGSNWTYKIPLDNCETSEEEDFSGGRP